MQEQFGKFQETEETYELKNEEYNVKLQIRRFRFAYLSRYCVVLKEHIHVIHRNNEMIPGYQCAIKIP